MKTKLNVYLTGALVFLLFVIASPAAAQRFISFDFPGAPSTPRLPPTLSYARNFKIFRSRQICPAGGFCDQ